jgi:hypothetical protein
MAGGRKANQERRRQAARLRARGLTLGEIGRRLGVTRQAAASLLRPLRGAARRLPGGDGPARGGAGLAG